MQRYFIGSNLQFTEQDLHHIKNVMRMKVGDNIIGICNEEGNIYSLKIDSLNPFRVAICESSPIINQQIPVTLLVPVIKRNNFELVLQKATELGVSKIVPVNTQRCAKEMDREFFERKLERYQMILKEAAEQCGAVVIPELCPPVKFIDIQPYLSDINYIAVPQAETIGDEVGATTILIGPEGGFTSKEVLLATKMGFKPVGLGARTLRAETACIAALSYLAIINGRQND